MKSPTLELLRRPTESIYGLSQPPRYNHEMNWKQNSTLWCFAMWFIIWCKVGLKKIFLFFFPFFFNHDFKMNNKVFQLTWTEQTTNAQCVCALFLCSVKGYVLQCGETAHRTVHHHYYYCESAAWPVSLSTEAAGLSSWGSAGRCHCRTWLPWWTARWAGVLLPVPADL